MLSHTLTGDLNNSKNIILKGGYNNKVELTLLWSVYCEFGFPTTALPPDPSSDATMTVALSSEASSLQTSSSSPPSSSSLPPFSSSSSSVSPSPGVENSQNNQIPLIAGAAGGGVVVLVIVIVVIGVVVCRRRRDSDTRRMSHADSSQPKRPTSMPSMPSMPPPIDPHRYEEKEFPPSQDKTYEGPSVPSFARSDENPAYGCKPDNMYETMEDAVKKSQDRSLPRPPNEYSETNNSKYLTLK